MKAVISVFIGSPYKVTSSRFIQPANLQKVLIPYCITTTHSACIGPGTAELTTGAESYSDHYTNGAATTDTTATTATTTTSTATNTTNNNTTNHASLHTSNRP